MQKISLLELKSSLQAWSIDAEPVVRLIAGESFFVFECDELSQEAWACVSRNSGICFSGKLLENGMLLPLNREDHFFLPEDLPHVLKYKGKTNADFTYLMLHCVKSASAFAKVQTPLQVLDPMCGKSTSLFCAACEGHNAVGIEIDTKALNESATYFERFLQMHRLKHKKINDTYTLRNGGSARRVTFETAEDADRFKKGEHQTIQMVNADSSRADDILKAESCHLIICDLPYGVQHAPKDSGKISSFSKLLKQCLPSWAKVLKHGGAMALSFNLYTLPRKHLEQLMMEAGLAVCQEACYRDFSHWVEQAVERDIVIARKA